MPADRLVVEDREFAQFLARIVRAMARRAGSNIDALPLLAAAADEVEVMLVEAVTRCRADGYSWADVGRRLGISRQAAQQRFSVKD